MVIVYFQLAVVGTENMITNKPMQDQEKLNGLYFIQCHSHHKP
jgi:hypothetical protein